MITSLISTIIEFLTTHPHIAYWAVFLLALSESIPMIGVVVPGTAVIVALSTLVSSGVLILWPLLAAATLGAIAGDGLAFWLGHRFRGGILGVWPLNKHPELVRHSEAFFARHGDKSVFIARFTPGVRAFIPLLAGILQMSVRRFYVVNIASAIIWAPVHILPGVFIGAAFSILGASAKPLAILLVAILVVGWIILHIFRWILRRGIPLLFSGAERVRIWADRHDTWLGRQISNLFDPSRSVARSLAWPITVLVGAAWLFLGILEDVVSGDPLVLADSAIYHALQELRTTAGDMVMIAITELGDTVVVVAVTMIVFLWLIWKRAWYTALYWLIAIIGASALNTVIKVALHRQRPGDMLYAGWGEFSFPSGHSTINLVLYGFAAFLVIREIRLAWRIPVAIGTAILILLIGFSRLYLGAHWMSDVLAGLAFGSTWLALLGLSYLRRPREYVEPVGMLAVVCTALVLVGGFNIYYNHAKDRDRYAFKIVVPTMAMAEWWSSGWKQLPVRRIDLTGEAQEPLTFQWAGDLKGLQNTFQQCGWQVSTPWSLLSSMTWLNAQTDPAKLPVLPSFASGRLASLTLVQPSNDGASARSRIVLRLWTVDLELTNGQNSPLWIGSVVEERLSHPLALGTLVTTQADANKPRQALAGLLDGEQLVSRQNQTTEAEWDGRVILARQLQLPCLK